MTDRSRLSFWRLFRCWHSDGLHRESRDGVRGLACLHCGHWEPIVIRTKAERIAMVKRWPAIAAPKAKAVTAAERRRESLARSLDAGQVVDALPPHPGVTSRTVPAVDATSCAPAVGVRRAAPEAVVPIRRRA